MLESAAPLLASELVDRYLEGVRAGRGHGHHAVAFAVTMQAAGLASEEMLLALAATAVSGFVAAAVRLGLIGQTAAQRIVTDLHPLMIQMAAEAREIPLDDLGGYLPLVDLAGLRQEHLAGRLFAS